MTKKNKQSQIEETKSNTQKTKLRPGFIKRSASTPLSVILATGKFYTEQTAAEGDGYSD
jgi:hypothetical protein